MTTTIRAHFDGRVIIPDEPVDLPVDKPLTFDVRDPRFVSQPVNEEDRRNALNELLSRPIPGLNIPNSALRRENLYEDK
jgi:hypothetical protein